MTWVSWLGVLLPPFLQHFPLLRFSRSANKSKIEMNIKGMAITTWEIFCKRVNPLQESEIVSLISEKRETMSFDHCVQFILFSLLIQWAASSSVVSGNSLFVLIFAIWFFSLFFLNIYNGWPFFGCLHADDIFESYKATSRNLLQVKESMFFVNKLILNCSFSFLLAECRIRRYWYFNVEKQASIN